MNKIYSYNEVEICKKDLCLKATGKNADLIARAAVIMLLFVGIAALISAVK